MRFLRARAQFTPAAVPIPGAGRVFGAPQAYSRGMYNSGVNMFGSNLYGSSFGAGLATASATRGLNSYSVGYAPGRFLRGTNANVNLHSDGTAYARNMKLYNSFRAAAAPVAAAGL